MMSCLLVYVYLRNEVRQQIFLYFSIVILCISCANIMSPTGGPVDKEAPVMAQQSTKDSSVNFKGGKMIFSFNERIDPNKVKVETFPLMKSQPKVSVDKRDVILTIPDSLLEENTTYKISFGNTITDIYEGNALGKLDFTFSTGNAIDSLQLNGQVVEAATGRPDTQALVLLYTKIEGDSDVQYKKPLYVKKVDAYGVFNFGNLPAKEFYIYAVADKNANYVYDLLGERIAFINTTVLPIQSSENLLKLYTFSESTDTTQSKAGNRGKTNVVVPRFQINIDTTDAKKRTFDITQPITLTFKNKIEQLKTSNIRLYINDVLDETGLVSFDSIKNKVTINVELLPDTVYRLQLLTGFAKDTADMLGNTFVFRTKKLTDYGSLIVSALPNPDFKGQRILKLMQNNLLIAEQKITDSTATFSNLNPGNYFFQILYDENSNDKWDSGLYKLGKRQPEKVELFSKEALVKANATNKVAWPSTIETKAQKPKTDDLPSNAIDKDKKQ